MLSSIVSCFTEGLLFVLEYCSQRLVRPFLGGICCWTLMPAYVIDNAEGVWPRPFEQCRIFVCFRRLDFDPPFSGQRFDKLLWSPALVGLPFRVWHVINPCQLGQLKTHLQ